MFTCSMNVCVSTQSYDIVINLIHSLQFDNSPLHIASWNNKREVAELLIQHGADINSKNHVDFSPIPISDISPSHYLTILMKQSVI